MISSLHCVVITELICWEILIPKLLWLVVLCEKIWNDMWKSFQFVKTCSILCKIYLGIQLALVAQNRMALAKYMSSWTASIHCINLQENFPYDMRWFKLCRRECKTYHLTFRYSSWKLWESLSPAHPIQLAALIPFIKRRWGKEALDFLQMARSSHRTR